MCHPDKNIQPADLEVAMDTQLEAMIDCVKVNDHAYNRALCFSFSLSFSLHHFLFPLPLIIPFPPSLLLYQVFDGLINILVIPAVQGMESLLGIILRHARTVTDAYLRVW